MNWCDINKTEMVLFIPTPGMISFVAQSKYNRFCKS